MALACRACPLHSGSAMYLRKRTVTYITLAIALLAIGTTTVLAVRRAHQEGFEAQRDRMRAYAYDITHRTDATAAQALAGIAKLVATGNTYGPCSQQNRDVMREIDL